MSNPEQQTRGKADREAEATAAGAGAAGMVMGRQDDDSTSTMRITGAAPQPQPQRRRQARTRMSMALVLLLGAALLLACACVGVRAAAAGGQQAQRGAGKQGKGQGKRKAVVNLSSEELLEHLEFWSTDVALFFYAPWCPYCKLVGPYWDMVGEWHLEQQTQNLLMARFDCEQDALATDICVYMGVTHYPTIQFLGAGSYYQNDPISSLIYGKQNVDRAVFFEGVPDPEILKDWTNMMRGISQWHRFKARVLGAVGLGGKAGAVLPKEAMDKIRGLEKENRELREENRWLAKKATAGGGGSSLYDEYDYYGKGKGGGLGEEDDPWAAASAAAQAAVGGDEAALEQYYEELMKSLETGHGANGDEPASPEEVDAALEKMAEEVLGPVRGSLGHGDPFEELAHQTLTADETDVVLACIGDFAGDYCRELSAAGEGATEPFCALLPECVAEGFAPAACRPAQCPFAAEGCERIRNCLRGGVMDLYAQMLVPAGGQMEGAAAAGSSSSSSSQQGNAWGGGWFGSGGGKQGGEL